MAMSSDTPTGILSIAAAAIAAGGAVLQGIWKARDDREKEDRAKAQREAEEEAAAISARLHKLEERMGSQDVTNARQDETIRSIVTSLATLDRKMDRLDEKVDRILDRPGSSPGGRR